MASGNNVTDPYTPSNDTKLECLEEYKGCSATSPIQLIAGEKDDRGFNSAPEKGLLGSIPSILLVLLLLEWVVWRGTPHANC